MNELELNFDINLDLDFDLNIDLGFDAELKSNLIKPAYHKPINDNFVKYDNAKKLATDIGLLKEDQRAFAIISGSFIFGDFIEAYIVENELKVKELTISTLSMSMENIDSLLGLLECNDVAKMNLIISAYFFSHNRWTYIKHLDEQLKPEWDFTLAVAGTHCKTAIMELETGEKIVIHGSANLRSSANIEQFMIEENKQLYDFNYEYQEKIIKYYSATKKQLRVSKLWKEIT